ncbi:MAG: hypothetical protein ACLR0U_13505 [Enterocloster clostridioformis]
MGHTGGDIREHGPDDPYSGRGFHGNGGHCQWRALLLFTAWERVWEFYSTCIFRDQGAAIRSAQREIEEKFICLLSQMASELGEPGENGARTDGHRFQALEQALERRESAGPMRGWRTVFFGGHTLLPWLRGCGKTSLPSCAECGTVFRE